MFGFIEKWEQNYSKTFCVTSAMNNWKYIFKSESIILNFFFANEVLKIKNLLKKNCYRVKYIIWKCLL